MDRPLSINPVVNRLGLKTQTERNKQAETRAKKQKIIEQTLRRTFEKDLERYDNLVKQDQNDSVRLRRVVDKRHKAVKDERDTQEKVGTVTKSKTIGRFRYKQRKLDYQLEDELSGNLRQMKPMGNDVLLQDRFDSIFRRNLVEPDAPTMAEKKRQRKVSYKMFDRIGNKAMEIRDETALLKKRNDVKEKGFKHQIKDDVIMI